MDKFYLSQISLRDPKGKKIFSSEDLDCLLGHLSKLELEMKRDELRDTQSTYYFNVSSDKN